MGRRAGGKSTGKGHKNSRPKIRSSGMKQRGKGSASGYKPSSRSNKKSKGCFITTATCQTLGKSDNCQELTAIRFFRDNWLAHQLNGEKIIEDYYIIAPKIVGAINSEIDNAEIYQSIWKVHLAKFFNEIQREENENAFETYQNMVSELKTKYIES